MPRGKNVKREILTDPFITLTRTFNAVRICQLSLLITLLMSLAVKGQDQKYSIIQKLEDTGFENIRLHQSEEDLTIGVENNIYRWNVRGISAALDKVSEQAPSEGMIRLVMLRFGIPQVMITVPAEQWQNAHDSTLKHTLDSTLQVSYRLQKAWQTIRDQKPENRNTFKFDFVFYPQFYLTNLTFNTIYEVQFNIAPALQLSLWKGMQLTAQVILPIYSYNGVFGEEGKLVRPGFLVLSQDFRLPGPVFGNISIGNFNNYRYGVDFNLMYPFPNQRWDVGLNAGLTGYSIFRKDGWEFGKLETVTFFVSAGYYLPRFNLRFRASAGRFLYGDYGGRFDLTRMFGETAIGFYAAYSIETSDGAGYPNAGFHVSIPFPPGKRLKHRRLRVDLARYFEWEYNGATELIYNRYYERRPNENRSEHYFNPVYLQQEIVKYRLNR